MGRKISKVVKELMGIGGMAEYLWKRKYIDGRNYYDVEEELFQRGFNISIKIVSDIYNNHVKEDGIHYDGEMGGKALEDYPINEKVTKRSASRSNNEVPGEDAKKRLSNAEAYKIFEENRLHIIEHHEDERPLRVNFNWLVRFKERKRFGEYRYSERNLYELFKKYMENELDIKLHGRAKTEDEDPLELDSEFYL